MKTNYITRKILIMRKRHPLVNWREFALCRLWYMTCLSLELGLDSDRLAATSSPVEIGCVNVIPKCNEWTGKHPVYENMPETYAAINNYLAETPLEGILRFEHVELNLVWDLKRRLRCTSTFVCPTNTVGLCATTNKSDSLTNNIMFSNGFVTVAKKIYNYHLWVCLSVSNSSLL